MTVDSCRPQCYLGDGAEVEQTVSPAGEHVLTDVEATPRTAPPGGLHRQRTVTVNAVRQRRAGRPAMGSATFAGQQCSRQVTTLLVLSHHLL